MNLPPFLPLLLRLLHITATALDQEGGTSIPSESHRREEDVDGTGDFKGGTDLEREALVALYESTGGLTWRGWKEDGGWLEGDPCEDAWFDVTCDSVTGSVTELNLEYNDLKGTIPTEIGNLQALEKLSLAFNDLTGTIPTEIGNLQSLTGGLSLAFNDLTGTIPTEIGNLQALEGLDLDSNDLTGTIPTEIGNLQSLEGLDLHFNKLFGTIPTEIGNLQALEKLNLDYNDQFGRERPVPSYSSQP